LEEFEKEEKNPKGPFAAFQSRLKDACDRLQRFMNSSPPKKEKEKEKKEEEKKKDKK